MKKIEFLIACLLPLAMMAQSTSPDVIASSGDFYSNPAGSLSWTLGEPVTETFTGGGITLTQGFQQPISISISGIDLNLLAFMEGPFNGSVMNTDLTGLTGFPLTQPYSTTPWNYEGTESVVTVPANVTDWILIELRDAPTAEGATAATRIARQAAFLMNDGSVVGTDGISNLYFPYTPISHLFVVIWHRNHLGILSGNYLVQSGGIYSYDFTTPAGQAYGTGSQKNLGGALYGMYAGDADATGVIDLADKNNVWALQAGETGYLSGDFNMNSQVGNQDKNDHWLGNLNEEVQVPE